MKKINVLIAGLVILLSLGLNAFTESEQHALNRGDGGGAPARPDYVSFNKGDGGVPVKPDYTRGDTGGAPADNRGDGGAPANFNKGDGGDISKQDSHADHF